MSKPIVTIEDWEVVQSPTCQAFEELHPGNRLTGYVHGHAKLPHTKRVYTSAIVGINLGEGVVETLNTKYLLGEASDEYKAWEHKRKSDTHRINTPV